MAASRESLRIAFGQALRRLRQEGSFSLDDVQHATASQGLAITRSHLSRVETGNADLNLPRFLVLLRALGASPSAVTEGLCGLLDGQQLLSDPSVDTAWSALRDGDAARAAEVWRRGAHAIPTDDLATLGAWAHCETRLGRWHRADDVLQRITAPSDETAIHLAVRRCAMLLAGGHPTWAGLMARASGESPAGRSALATCALAAGDADRTLNIVGGTDTAEWPLTWRRLAALLTAAAFRLRGQRRAALQWLVAALEGGSLDWVHAEALLLQASLCADRAAARTALAAIDSARSIARGLAAPALLARCHDAAAALSRQYGEAREARDAERAAQAVRRRAQAEAPFESSWPLLALHAAAGDDSAAPANRAAP